MAVWHEKWRHLHVGKTRHMAYLGNPLNNKSNTVYKYTSTRMD